MKFSPSMWQFLNERIGTKYLDVAEMLPNFKGGSIRLLQNARNRQRTSAQEAFMKTRPMEGVSLKFDQLLLIEIFPIEDYTSLEQQLQKLFPGNQKLEEMMDSFSDVANNLFSGGWSNIGHIVREKVNSFFFPFAVATLPELPEEVYLIDISVSKVLPSIFAVSFNVFLAQEATERLQSLLGRHYLPHITFGGILPLRKNLNRRSELGSEQVMRKEVLQSLADLRLKIERQLRSKLKGIFLRLPKKQSPQLPAIEMLSIYGISPSPDSMREGLNRNSAWMNCFGLTHWRTNQLFTNSEMLFQWSENDGGSENHSYKLVAFVEKDESPEFQERNRLAWEDIARSITPLIASFGFIESTRRDLERLRITVYKTLTKNSFLKNLTRDIRLNNEVQLKQMILLRLQFELKSSRWGIEQEAGQMREFVMLNQIHPGTLGDAFLNAIDNRLERLCGHSEVVSNVLSAYLQRRNLDVAYRLQRRLFWWTALVSLVTVYGMAKDWPAFQHIICWIRLRFH